MILTLDIATNSLQTPLAKVESYDRTQKVSSRDVPYLDNSIVFTTNSFQFFEKIVRMLYVTDGNEPIDFVEKNNILIQVLTEMPKIISKYFDTATLGLSLHTDPVENYKTLFLSISTDLSFDNAFDRQRKLFKDPHFNYFTKQRAINTLLSFDIKTT
jgi:hypothetical protein